MKMNDGRERLLRADAARLSETAFTFRNNYVMSRAGETKLEQFVLNRKRRRVTKCHARQGLVFVLVVRFQAGDGSRGAGGDVSMCARSRG